MINEAVMKDKILYLISLVAVAAAINFALENVESGSLFGASGGSSRSLALDMTSAPAEVNTTISELKAHRPHLSETCLYGAAMLMNNLGDDAKDAIDKEGKCIHTLVMFIAREKQRARGVNTDPAKLAAKTSDDSAID